ncbi:hypothetical protein [Streptomyces sp. NBC_01500]|uniref:hypothetical protein n=1 Tax=Streptomyces sp. NBC_01500 TaxID=2903886 RepID=UPI00225BBE44|nr:hypothetical protein [Streptomyces sp. NBC_01500]MCX4551436.1 hypothetical protein [Streptomyces sp. NBC_01500]
MSTTYEKDDFYSRDRSPNATMPEDRPRGGGPRAPLKHRGPLAVVLMTAAIILLIIVGVALFP